MIYLDNAATTACSKEVVDAMLPFMELEFGNPESPHQAGTVPADAIFEARKNVAALFNDTHAFHVFFTSGGTEANNLAILGAERYLRSSGKTHLITSMSEHKSVLEAFKRLENNGFQVSYLYPNRDGIIHAEQVQRALRPNTGLVSVMFVNNETGCVNESAKIGMLLENKTGILYHIDCVQAAGCFDLNHRFLRADMISVSAHKIHGPKGMGCLWIKEPEKISPILCGGEQEMYLRPGTQNVPGIIGFGVAAKLALENQFERAAHIRDLEKLMYQTMSGSVKGIHRNFPLESTCKKVASYRIDGVDAETLVQALDVRDVCVSTGAACNTSSSVPSYVLIASGLNFQEAASTIRVSFSGKNTPEEIVNAAHIVADTVTFLRNRAT